MKKVYEKPQIMFEDFALSTSVAAGCEFTDVNATQGVCAYEMLSGHMMKNVFTSEIFACKTKEDSGEYNGICYHVPDGYNIFNS